AQEPESEQHCDGDGEKLMLDMLRWLPDGYGGVSSYAGDIDAVFRFIYWLTFAIFWLVTILMVVFLYRYHHREGDTRRATYTHGNAASGLSWSMTAAIGRSGTGFGRDAAAATSKAGPPPPDQAVQLKAPRLSLSVPGPVWRGRTAFRRGAAAQPRGA